MNTLENPILFREKWDFPGYTLFLLFWLENTDCGYSLEPPHRGGSNEHLQSMFETNIKKISLIFN